MRKKRWLRSTVSFVLVAAMCLGLTLSGNLGRVLAEDTEITLVNAGFTTDIWASEGAGWSTDGTDWGAAQGDTTVKTNDADHEGQLNFWKKDAGNVILKQSVELEAGTYQLGVEVIDGENAAISLLFGGETGTSTAISSTGVQSNEFTLLASGSVEIGVCIAVEAGGWGHIDNVSLKKVEKTQNPDEGNDSETEYLDDMESEADAFWTVTWENETGVTCSREPNEYAENNTTSWWVFKLNNAPAQTVHISREITLAAGKYAASVESDGGNVNSGKIILSDGTTSKEAAMGFTAWDDWTTATTDVLDVTEETTLTLTIEVSLMAEGWFDLDNVKVVPVSEDEEAAKKAQKVEELQALVAECGGLVESEYTADSWMALTTALDNANAVIADKDNKTIDEIAAAHAALDTAKTGLVFAVPVVDGDLNIERIAGLPQDFIMGMDISSVMSEFASGVTYKDYDGNTIDNIADFCKLLKANGITHIRVRVWNDPFDAAGKGYGGGNNDVATAKEIADGCRAAGLKMLVDFHCSDFWADPGKQQEPKAWKGYTLDQKKDAVKSFIAESLNTIDPSKDTVAMVQVGNETTGAFVGEENTADMCVLFQAGAEAVKAYNSDVKVVIHVTNPEKGNVTKWAKNLSDNSVAYDILATSYYPYWHGTLENLKSEFEKVKTDYGKDVMVAETSYAYTLTDSDGHNNTVRVGNNDDGANTKQPFTVQGQATAIRNLMSTVKDAGGLGVFYWEPAWLTVGDTRGLEGDAFDAQVNANKEKWEAYGSGWAASYAAEYDPDDAGKWFGGTAVDNEAMFYPDGTPTAALHVWNYVKTGAVNKSVSVDQIGTVAETIEVNGTYTLPDTVTVSYNTGNKEDPVTWENKAIDVSKPGSYVVKGTVTFSETVTSGEYNGQTSAKTTYTLDIIPSNLIKDRDDAGFEKGDNFTVGGSGISSIPATDDPYAGTKSMHWYSASATQGTVNYNKGITLGAGEYTFEAKAQGAEGDNVTLKILDAEGNELFVGEPTAVGGWKNWQTPSVSFTLEKETEVYLQIVVDIAAGGWGTADALYLYQVLPGTITVEKPEVGAGAPQTTIASSADELQKAVLTADELASVESGKDIKISLKIGTKTVSDAERALIEAKLGKNTVGMYLDISLFKQIGDDAAIQVTDTNGEISISIAIPNELLNSNSAVTRTYRMIRIHNNAAELLEGSFDANTGYFTFKTDAFSTYVLVYEDVPVSSGSTDKPVTPPDGTTVIGKPQYDGWAGVSAEQKAKLMRESLAQNAAVTAPKTDDNAPLIIALLVMMAGAIVIAGAVAKKRESC